MTLVVVGQNGQPVNIEMNIDLNQYSPKLKVKIPQ